MKIKSGPCEEYPPSRWYGISRSLHRELRLKTLYASTSDVTGIRDYKFGAEYDVELLESLFSKSHTVRQFPDKIRDGYTFVFYLHDGDRALVEDLMESMRPRQEMKSRNPNKLSGRRKYHYLEVIPKYLRANSNFLASIGEFACDLLEIWYDGEEVPDYELEFLDNFAADCLINAGCIDRDNVPKRSEADLSGQGADKMEVGTPPLQSFDQPSLFP